MVGGCGWSTRRGLADRGHRLELVLGGGGKARSLLEGVSQVRPWQLRSPAAQPQGQGVPSTGTPTASALTMPVNTTLPPDQDGENAPAEYVGLGSGDCMQRKRERGVGGDLRFH